MKVTLRTRSFQEKRGVCSKTEHGSGAGNVSKDVVEGMSDMVGEYLAMESNSIMSVAGTVKVVDPAKNFLMNEVGDAEYL